MLNLVHLRTLVEVLRLGSFTGAGNRLGYTASAVSQQMSALERETGIELFVRSARSAHPTDSAHVVGQHALKLLRDADGLMAAASASVHGSARELRIGAFPSAAMFILADVLESPDWQDLGIQLKITIGEPSTTVPRLRAGGELDLAIIYQVGESGLVLPQGVSRHWIGDDPYCVAVPTAWGMSEGSRIPTTELANKPWLLHHRGSSDATVIESTLANAELHPRVVATTDDFTATLRLIAAGHGMALIPRLTLASRPPGLTVVDVPELALSRKLIALCAEAAPVEAAREFVRMAAALTGPAD